MSGSAVSGDSEDIITDLMYSPLTPASTQTLHNYMELRPRGGLSSETLQLIGFILHLSPPAAPHPI